MREGSVRVRGARIHYVAWGAGARTLVCLHRSGGNAWHWQRLARGLCRRGYRVVALDQRGHGDSSAPARGYGVNDFARDLEGVRAALGLERFDLLGASLGSRVALVYAATHPDRVDRLVLVEPSFAMPAAEQRRMIAGQRGRPSSFASLREALAWSRSQPVRGRWPRSLHAEIVPHELRRRRDGRWTWRHNPAAAIATLRAARRSLWPYARRVRAPALVVRGERSRALDRDTAGRIRRAIHGSRLVEVPDAAHGVMHDRPAAFNRVVREWLVSSTARSAG